MLAKLTAKNRLTLPKAIIDAVGSAEYFEVEARGSQIVLTPVRIRRADSVRARIAELDLTEADITGAVRRARRPGYPPKLRK
jgi:translation initiation factor IF-1